MARDQVERRVCSGRLKERVGLGWRAGWSPGGQTQMAEDPLNDRGVFDACPEPAEGAAIMVKGPPQFGQAVMSISKEQFSYCISRSGTDTADLYGNFVSGAINGNPFGPETNLPGFSVAPVATWGLKVRYDPTDSAYLMAGVFYSDPVIGLDSKQVNTKLGQSAVS